jgi:hypothetical protein
LAEIGDRERDDWLERLGVAIAASTAPEATDDPRGMPPTPLPSWPWAISSLGLCLALLVVAPGTVETGDEGQRPKTAAPQVHGWRSSAINVRVWPEDLPFSGYRGVASSQPTPAAILDRPIHPLPPVIETRPAPTEQNTADAAPMPVLATRPPNFPLIDPETSTGTFVPTQATWVARIAIGTPPRMTAEPQPPQQLIVAPPPPDDDDPPARPRKALSIRGKRERRVAAPKSATETPFEHGPVWVEKVFGPPRS